MLNKMLTLQSTARLITPTPFFFQNQRSENELLNESERTPRAKPDQDKDIRNVFKRHRGQKCGGVISPNLERG